MRKGFIWFQRALWLGLVPGTLQACSYKPRDDGRPSFQERTALSLRDIAARKLHHGPNGFRNPFTNTEYRDAGRLLYWKLFSRNGFRSYYREEPVRPVSVDWNQVRDHNGLSVTFIKHASVLIKDGDRYFLVDPIFGRLFPTIKDFTPLAFDLDEMPRLDHVLITHGHYDHLDTASLAALPPDVHVISPLGYDDVFLGLKMSNRTRLDWYQSHKSDGREVILVPCNHWTMRNPLVGPNRSLWGAYILKTASGPTIFISGDAGYFEGYKELGREYPIDLAIFNLGAYEPRWFMKDHHMNPEETARSFRELGAKRLMIVHWGSFRLGDEPVHFPPRDMQREMARLNLRERLVHLDHGQTLFF